jgi:hypothetical protein
MPMTLLYPLTAHERRRVAVFAAVDPRTVVRFLRGQPVASTCAARIREALRRLDILPDDSDPPRPVATEPPRPGLAVARDQRGGDRRKGAARGAA